MTCDHLPGERRVIMAGGHRWRDDPPAVWVQFRERNRAADAVLFVTPEHNRSVPAALKNTLDIGSRPYGQSVWNGKPGAVVSASPGGIGL